MVKSPHASGGGTREVGSVPKSGAALGIGHGDPWTEEHGRLQSTEPQRAGHNQAHTLHKSGLSTSVWRDLKGRRQRLQ